MRYVLIAAVLGALAAAIALRLANPRTTFTEFRGLYSDGVFDAGNELMLEADGHWRWTFTTSLDMSVAEGTAREENGVLLLTPSSGTGVFSTDSPPRMIPVRADDWRFLLRETEVDEFEQWTRTGRSKSFGFMHCPAEGIPAPPFEHVSAPPEFAARWR
ncbi:MAG: hypothetical protein HZA52_19360 [Planctomycetes bacterium]|nr:hypothetical protein [Planctomycetota bacterium]